MIALSVDAFRGGVGYWQKIREVFPEKFEYMANMEHEITEIRRKYLIENDKFNEEEFQPVTICKNQRQGFKGDRLFLKHNPKYPHIQTIDVVKGRQPVTVFECGLTCNNDLFDI